MIYASLQDLVDHYGAQPVVQLADRQQPFLGELDAAAVAVVDAALADASAEVDGYVIARYTHGFAQPPRLLSSICRSLAWLILHRDRPTEEALADAAAVRKTLRDIAQGLIMLPDTAGTPLVPPDRPAFVAPARIFTDDTMEGF